MPCAFAAIMLMLPPSQEEYARAQKCIEWIASQLVIMKNPPPSRMPITIEQYRRDIAQCLKELSWMNATHTPIGRFVRVGIAP
jgi:hypothetical protein